MIRWMMIDEVDEIHELLLLRIMINGARYSVLVLILLSFLLYYIRQLQASVYNFTISASESTSSHH